MRHYVIVWLEDGREVVKELKQKMVLVWIFRNELFTNYSQN